MSDTVKYYLGRMIYSLRDAEKANEEGGFYFFTKDTMRFFSSRVSEGSFCMNDSRRCTYFVTSEQNKGFGGNYPRLYTVRAIDWDTGDVRTVGEFQQYRTAATAKAWAKRYAFAGMNEPSKDQALRV